MSRDGRELSRQLLVLDFPEVIDDVPGEAMYCVSHRPLRRDMSFRRGNADSVQDCYATQRSVARVDGLRPATGGA